MVMRFGKRMLCLVLALGLTGILCAGCGEQMQAQPSGAAPESTGESRIQEEQQQSTILDTEYYTLELPPSWVEGCVYEITQGDWYNYDLHFYEKESYESFGGGLLFSLRLVNEGDGYSHFPDYEVLGSLEVYRIGGYNIVVTYPTDVQFSGETAESYGNVCPHIPAVLASLRFKEECTFSELPLPVETEPVPETFSCRACGKWVHVPNMLESMNLLIYEDGTFLVAYNYMGEVREKITGTYTILSDDGKFQEFLFRNGADPQDSWTAWIWPTMLENSHGDTTQGLEYRNEENQTLYFTGDFWN